MYDKRESRNGQKTVVKIPDRKRPPARPRRRGEHNNKIYCK
jgi:hypothetical protein